jgi:hypothetical protein
MQEGILVCVCVCSEIVIQYIQGGGRQYNDTQNPKQTDAVFEYTSLHKLTVSIKTVLMTAGRRMLHYL